MQFPQYLKNAYITVYNFSLYKDKSRQKTPIDISASLFKDSLINTYVSTMRSHEYENNAEDQMLYAISKSVNNYGNSSKKCLPFYFGGYHHYNNISDWVNK